MVVLELNHVEIDYCLDCNGTWLDAGELELLLEDRQLVEALLSQLNENQNLDKSNRKCPICSKKMELISLHGKADVVLDRCRRGHGLWFDKGELEQVISIFDKEDHHKVLRYLKDIFAN
jgi:hypothetical protein